MSEHNPNFVTAEELYKASLDGREADDWTSVPAHTKSAWDRAAKCANQKIAGVIGQLRVYDNVLAGFKRMLDGKIGRPAD